MQIKIRDNYKQFISDLKRVEKKQVPFASMRAINKIGPMMQKHYKLKMRKVFNNPTPFTERAFGFFKANLRTLTGVFFIKSLQEDYLKYQIDGGIRSTGKKIPVPFWNARLNKYGNIIGKRSGLIKKDTQFIGRVKGVDGVFERQRSGPPKLLYMFHDSVSYNKGRFDFFGIGQNFIDRYFKKLLRREIKKAVKK